MDWHKLEDDIVQRLDVRGEFANLGVEFVGKVRESGYAECKAWGREDKSASACVNIDTGHYKDSGGDGKEITLWQFACNAGRFPTWQEARQYYASKVGIELPGYTGGVNVGSELCTFCRKPGHWRPDCPDLEQHVKEERKKVLTFVADPKTEDTSGIITIISNWIRLFKKCPIITCDGCIKAGAVLGTKHFKDKQVDSVIGWESYDSEGQVTGAIVVSRASEKIKVKIGDGEESYSKCQSLGEPGLVGRGGVYHLLRGEEPQIILKCEGLSDMLAAYSKMPTVSEIATQGLVDTPWPVTNKNGAVEHPKPYLDILKKAREVWLVHDRDESGLKGTEKWSSALHEAGVKVKVIILPYPLEWNHGKDLRDYFKDHTWADLMALASATPYYDPQKVPPYDCPPNCGNGGGGGRAVHPPAGDNPGNPLNDDILERCGLHVLGQDKDGRVEIYSSYLERVCIIPQMRSFCYVDAILKFGDVIRQHVAERHEEDDPRPTVNTLKSKIAVEASKRILTEEKRLGTGVWKESDNLVLVNGSTAWVMSSDKSFTKIPAPVFNEKVITLRDGDQWFNPNELIDDIKSLTDEDQKMYTQKIVDFFSLWNFEAKDTKHNKQLANLYTGLIGAMLLQTIWTWRPLITVNGSASSGKTELLTRTMDLLGGLPLAHKLDKPTFAGIRQYCQDNAYCICIDEFEKTRNRQDAFDGFRMLSAGASTVRGTAHHEAKKWNLKVMPLIAAIESGIKMAADDSRRVSFELKRPEISYGEFLKKIPSDTELQSLSRKFRASVLSSAWRAMQLEYVLRTTQPDLNQRRKDSYACGVAVICSLLLKTDAEAQDMLKDLVLWVESQTDTDLKSDEVRAIQTILDKPIRIDGGIIVSLRQWYDKMTQTAYEPSDAEKKWMDILGFRVTNKGKYVAIHPKKVEEVLKGTDFEGMQIKEILKRIDGTKYQVTTWYSTKPVKTFLIPIESFAKLANPDEHNEEVPF